MVRNTVYDSGAGKEGDETMKTIMKRMILHFKDGTTREHLVNVEYIDKLKAKYQFELGLEYVEVI